MPPLSDGPPAARCWTLLSARGASDVEVVAADGATLAAVLPMVEQVTGAPVESLWAGSTRLGGEVRLGHPALAHGAVLGCDRPGPRGAFGDQRSGALELHVVGGPESGRTLPLDRGRHVLGRGATATVPLEDPDVSRRHVLVEVAAGGVTARDLGSTNGSRLDGEPLDDRPRPWPTGAVLRIGASALTTTGPAGAPAALEPAPGGRTRLRPAVRLSVPVAACEVAFPPPPPAPQRRPLAWVAVALPAVGGAVLALLLDAPYFLFFALLSPVVAVGTWLSDRWSGRRGRRRADQEHARAMEEAERRAAEAVRRDVRAAEVAAPDLATVTAAVHRRTVLLWQRRGDDADALAVRVATGPGTTRVVRVQPDGGRSAEPADHLPVVVELATGGGLGVTGPRARGLGVLAGVIAQLAALHAPGEVDLALLTSRRRLPDWAWLRWLPHATPARVHVTEEDEPAGDAALRWLAGLVAERHVPGASGGPPTAPPAGTARGWLVVLVDHPAHPRLQAALRDARSSGVVALTLAGSLALLPAATETVLVLAGETGDAGRLVRSGRPDREGLAVDRLPPDVTAVLARRLGALVPPAADHGLPEQVRLLELAAAGGTDAAAGPEGAWSRCRRSLVATLGRTADGVARLDLCRTGPHVLIAGTTGAGKSELLQTMIAGLALHHPPDRCSFLLVDYKGGAAFAEAAALPHTVGLVTDLDARATARALRSLTAELSRREALLAAHGAADITALADDVDLARLVIVVDEFAGLAEELPVFVTGLVGIAQRGRSLGVHLVLATQRPGGVVSPEIRANCTLRICLRTTDEADSRDVLGTAQAARIPVDRPGRAYLRTGSAEPVALQVARVGVAQLPAASSAPTVRRWQWPPAGPDRADAADGTGGPAAGRATDLARLVEGLRRRADRAGTAMPHTPWCPPLPDHLVPADLSMPVTAGDRRPAAPSGGRGTTPQRVRLGLVDRPDLQRREPLELDLRRGGAWLAVGGPRSGRTTFLRAALAEAVAALPPDELHVHVLDHGGGALAGAAAGLPHTGTAVGGDDSLRTVRLLDRLVQEVTTRRAGAGGGDRPGVLLLVDGVDALTGQLDDVDPGRGAAAFLRLVRDGAAVGLTCLITADRGVPGGRLAAAVDHRLVLPLPDRADYAIAGIPAGAVPEHRPPGRALLGDDALECQLVRPRPLTEARHEPARRGRSRAPRIVELPADPEIALTRGTAGGAAVLPLGPGGDEGALLSVDLARYGGLLVAGPPGSGRSSALGAFARHLSTGAVPVLHLVGAAAALPAPGTASAGTTWLAGEDVAGWRTWVDSLGGRTGVVVLDDHGTLAECPVLAACAAEDVLPRPVFLVAGTPGELSSAYRGPVAALRRSRSGLLLRPSPGDGDLLGVRLPRTPVPARPGSGWWVADGLPTRVQVARRRQPAPRPGA